MDRADTVMGWRLGHWAYLAAFYQRHVQRRPRADLSGAGVLRSYWALRCPRERFPGERPTSAEYDFAWASRLLENALEESGAFRAKVGQEKGADDYQSPTP